MSQIPSDHAWWLPQQVACGQTLECLIGPLTVEIHHAAGEWHLGVAQGEESEGHGSACMALRQGGVREEDYQRFMVTDTGTRLTLSPLLCDRPVVIRPRQSVFLPSGEAVTLYVSTPTTLRVEVGEPAVLLREVPTVTLSDTWFGPSTLEGELCYAGKTQTRRALDEVPHRAHRVITPVRIRNEGDAVLPLEKLSLPVPVLSVFGADDGRLWTQGVSLVRSGVSDMAALVVDDAPPDYAGRVKRLSAPRQPRAHGGLVRAFSMLFGDRR